MSIIGGVLFSTFRKCLGKQYSSDIEESWMVAYSVFLSNIVNYFPSNSGSSYKQHCSEGGAII